MSTEEYYQITLDDWMEMKQKLKKELLGVKQSFVQIGYTLRQIDDQKLYERDGYKSIAEFAKTEYGLEPSTTSRFMSINREYSIDGYSERLRPEYAELSRSQLEEMLQLPDEDRQMVQPETPREDIRELKRFSKEGPETGVADDIRQLVNMFFRENRELLDEVYADTGFADGDDKRLADIIIPSGNRTYRKGMYFLAMQENGIKVKKFGEEPRDMGWAEFFAVMRDIFPDHGSRTWEEYFGEPEKELPVEAPKQEQKKADARTERKASVKTEAAVPAENDAHAETKTDAPAQEGSGARKEPEEEMENAGQTGSATSVSVYGSRKAYLDSLSVKDAARYVSNLCLNLSRKGCLTVAMMVDPLKLEEWLQNEVDENGEEVEG